MSLVSVIVPAYNAEKTIRQTLKSALIQGDYIYEIIVVINGCIDGTESVVDEMTLESKKINLSEKTDIKELKFHAMQFYLLKK